MSEPGHRVVVAHDEAALRDAAVDVSRAGGYETVGVAEGESARVLLHSVPTPAVMIVDVALPKMLGYELCDEVTRAGLETRVILIASVYSKTAYKRNPTSLYGAFDYVEQHHIVDQLGEKIDAAIAHLPRTTRRRAKSQTGELRAVRIQKAGESRLSFRYRTSAEAVARATRLARLIVADVVLYSAEEIEVWQVNDDAAMPERLAADLAEGRRVFELRVPREIATQRDFLGDALREFVRTRERAGGEAP